MLNNLLQKISSPLGITPDELKKALIFPILLLIMVFIGDIIWRSIGLPGAEETVEIIKRLFANYGYPLVFAAALVEALLLVGLYVPGSIALILSATLAGQGVLNIWLVIFIVIIGMLSAVVINFILGKYGWYHLLVKFGLKNAIDKMKVRAETKGIKIIHLTYFNPNLASLSATSFGILHVSFTRFLFHSIIAFVYWNILWGFAFYYLGSWIEERLNYTSLFIVIFAVIVVRLGYVIIKRKIHLTQS